MINFFKDLINPRNWLKLIQNPEKYKVIINRIFYYPGLRLNKYNSKFLNKAHKNFLVNFLNKIASKNISINYFFFW